MWLNVIFGAAAFISMAMLVAYRFQIKSIVEQIKFIREHDTNKLISRQISFKEIGELTGELNELMERYRAFAGEHTRKDVQLREAVMNISHDIRTPLTSLDGYFQLLKDCDSEEDEQRYYDIIGTRIRSLKDILEQMFIFVKIQNDSYEMDIEKCDVKEILCETLFSFYEDMKSRGIEPDIDITEDSCQCLAHEGSLRRAIQNIIKNSLDHGQDSIKVALKKEEEKSKIIIANRYVGDEYIEVDKVFDRFYKADKARTESSTGLGLAITKQLIDKMNGRIEAAIENGYFEISILI